MTRHSSEPSTTTHSCFVYGLLMDPARMKQVCPSSFGSGHGFLENHRLAFGGYSDKWGGGEAMLKQEKGARVLGRIYWIPDRELHLLDEHEGHPTRYERGHARVHIYLGGRERMLCYHLVDKVLETKPSAGYLSIIARAHERLGHTFEAQPFLTSREYQPTS